ARPARQRLDARPARRGSDGDPAERGGGGRGGRERGGYLRARPAARRQGPLRRRPNPGGSDRAHRRAAVSSLRDPRTGEWAGTAPRRAHGRGAVEPPRLWRGGDPRAQRGRRRGVRSCTKMRGGGPARRGGLRETLPVTQTLPRHGGAGADGPRLLGG